jgi:hypothetical protein
MQTSYKLGTRGSDGLLRDSLATVVGGAMPLQSFDRIASRIEYVNVETLSRRLQHSLATDMPIVVTQRCLRGTWMSVREPPMCVHRRKQMEVLVTICERKIYYSYFQYHGGIYHALHLLRSIH